MHPESHVGLGYRAVLSANEIAISRLSASDGIGDRLTGFSRQQWIHIRRVIASRLEVCREASELTRGLTRQGATACFRLRRKTVFLSRAPRSWVCAVASGVPRHMPS